jgi:hypothetical protein
MAPWLLGLALERQGVAALGWTMTCAAGALGLLLAMRLPSQNRR